MHSGAIPAAQQRADIVDRKLWRTSLRSARFALAYAASAFLWQSAVVQADTLDTTWVKGNAPFAGRWGLAGDSSTTPLGNHHRVFCRPANSAAYSSYQKCSTANVGPGDWAVDFYGPAGTGVYFNATASSGGALTAQVWAIMPSCTLAAGGSTVIIDLYVNGSREGFISYTHLDAVGVSPGKWINPGQLVGKLKKWTKSDCYQVTYDTGVHTHIEMFDLKKYACFYAYPLGGTVATSVALGQVGRTTYTGVNKKC